MHTLSRGYWILHLTILLNQLFGTVAGVGIVCKPITSLTIHPRSNHSPLVMPERGEMRVAVSVAIALLVIDPD
jgi:hypothetical protein